MGSSRMPERDRRGSGGRLRRYAVLVLTLLLGAARPAPAQTPDAVTPFVPRGHWSLDAAHRLEAAGLVDAGYDPGTTTVPLHQLAMLFEQAAVMAGGRAGLRSLAESYGARLVEEFPGLRAAPGRTPLRLLGGAVGADYDRQTGRALAGVGYFNDDWTGIRSLDDASEAQAVLRLLGVAGPHVAASVLPAVGDDVRLEEGHVVAGVGSVAVWAGRRAVRLGPGRTGGIVANDAVFLDGGGVSTRSFRLPWLLRVLGPFRMEALVSRLERNAGFDDPWFLVLRGRIAPHPRLAIGVNRGTMLGGAGNASIPFDEVLQGIVGLRPGDSRFDNQIVSLDLRYRPPLGELPLVTYLEFGAEDSAGAWKDVPGLLAGAELAAVPGLPQLAVGLEAATFARSCCGNPFWYRHWSFREGWTDQGRLLAHPLGGNGHELMVFGRVDALDARLRVDGRVFLRERRSENVHAPERAGDSAGIALDVELRADRRFELYLAGQVESGERDWDAMALSTGLRWLF